MWIMKSGKGDVQKVENIRTVWTQFEYGTSYYQYVIETSVDGKKWGFLAIFLQWVESTIWYPTVLTFGAVS